MRTRSEFSYHSQTTVTDYYPQTNTTNSFVESLGKDYERVTEDVVIPGFHKRSSNGEIFNNPFDSTATYYSYQGQYHNETWSQQSNPPWICVHVRDREGWWAVHNFASPFSPPDYAASAGNQALGGVNSTSFNAPLFIVEWHKTRQLIPQIGALLLRVARDGRRIVRKGKLVGYLPPTSKNLANAWLIGRFGVTPLLYELQGLTKLLTKPRPPRATSRGTSDWQSEVSSTYIVEDSCGNWSIKKTSRIDVRWRNGILYSAGAENASHLARLGYTRPATVAWELVPFSFVVDRFVDISSWLDAIQPDGASEYLAAWEGRREELYIKCEVNGFTPSEAYNLGAQRNSHFSGSATMFKTTKRRRPWTAQATLPVWNPHFNLKHLGDYAALVRQRIRSGT